MSENNEGIQNKEERQIEQIIKENQILKEENRQLNETIEQNKTRLEDAMESIIQY